MKRYVYFCPNEKALENYLNIQNDILSIENYIKEFGSDSSDGESSLVSTRSTKTFRNKSLQGFFIKSIDTEITISGEILKNVSEGQRCLFISLTG